MSVGALADKVVIVTGAAAGLGRAYALDCAAEGAAVVVNDIDSEGVEKVAAEITATGARALPSRHSVTDWEASGRIVELCLKTFGRVDGLVNNAGVLSLRLPWEEDNVSIRRTVEVNLIGSLFVGTHVMRAMVDQRFGSIVNITSSAQLGLATMGVYGSTKGGLASLTYDLAMTGVWRASSCPATGTDRQ